MRGKIETRQEPLPWYRKPSYRGKMPESHKRVLDRIRMKGPHPATTYSELPEEAQRYVTSLELEIYDAKQQFLFLGSLLFCVIGVILLYQWYKAGDPFNMLIGLIFAVVPWFYYRVQSKKNWNEFWPDGDSNRRTNEAMQMEWDIHYQPEGIDVD